MKRNVIISICLFLSILVLSTHSSALLLPMNHYNGFTDSLPSKRTVDTDLIEMFQKINESVLTQHIQTIQDFGPHPTGSQTLIQVQTYLYDQLEQTNFSVSLLPWRYKLRQGENIEATLAGKGTSDNIVILCAHYDSVAISPGADDDGSGVAALLSIAEVIDSYEFNATIRCVLFSGEEQGALGSHVYAHQSYLNDDHIIGVINLDGIGYAETTDDGNAIRDLADEEADWMVDISTTLVETYDELIDLTLLHQPNRPISDHASFNDFGYASSYFLEQTLNPYYHTSEDTIEHVNATYLTKVTRLTLGTLVTMAEVDRYLKNTDLRIMLEGSVLASPSQFQITIENTKYPVDTANLTINIALKNLLTKNYVTGPYNITSNWTFEKEVHEVWVYRVIAHSFASQCIILEVTIRGVQDDIGLYQKQRTIGLIISNIVLIIPRR